MDFAEIRLVQLSRSGDQSAFKELMRMYKDKIFRLAYVILHNNHDSEDIVQETFIRVYLKLHEYDPSQKFSTWIYHIGKNLSIDLLRKRKPTQSLDDSKPHDGGNFYEMVPSDDPTPESRMLESEVKNAFTGVIRKLPQKYQSIVSLYYLHDFSLQEISTHLNIPVTTVKSRLHRGREHLRKKWGLALFFNLLMLMSFFSP